MKNLPALMAGKPLSGASGALVLMHGRGAGAEDILSLAGLLGREDFAYLAPEARTGSWYPKSFLSPVEENEPDLSSALGVIGSLLELVEAAGITGERTFLLGFSQGACLVLEYAARTPRRYGGVFGLSGGLIGPPGGLRTYRGALASTPVLLGCSTTDPYIPLSRVTETRDILTALGATVSMRIHPGSDHRVTEDEIEFVRELSREPFTATDPTFPGRPGGAGNDESPARRNGLSRARTGPAFTFSRHTFSPEVLDTRKPLDTMQASTCFIQTVH